MIRMTSGCLRVFRVLRVLRVLEILGIFRTYKDNGVQMRDNSTRPDTFSTIHGVSCIYGNFRWSTLLSVLPDALYTDRCHYFECILAFMTRYEVSAILFMSCILA